MYNQDNTLSIDIYLKEGKKHKKTGALDKAIEKYLIALSIDSNSISALRDLAEVYDSKKDWSQAINYHQQLVQLKPGSSLDWAGLANALMEQGKTEDAILTYNKAINLSNPSMLACKGIAHALAKTDNLSEATKIYEQSLQFQSIQKLKPDDDRVEAFYYRLGKAIIQLGIKQERLNQAVICFKKAGETQPDNFWHFYYSGLALFEQNYLDEAVPYYRKAISIKPKFYQAYVALGNLFNQQGKRYKAFNNYIKALRINPYLGDINKLCGDWFYKYYNQCSQEELEAKVKEYQNIIDKVDSAQVKSVHLYLHLGRALVKVGKIAEAVKYNTKACCHNIEKDYPELADLNWDRDQRKAPSFLVIGVMKCGTTAIYDYIVQHPQVLPALVKEIHFFDKFFKEDKKEKIGSVKSDKYSIDLSRELYLSYFPVIPETANTKFITGEGSPSYITTLGVEKLVSQFCPKAKLIVLLRDPVKRAISQYYMSVRQGSQNVSLEKIFEAELEQLKIIDNNMTVEEFQKKTKTRYLLQGLYTYFLENWIKFFPKEQFLILRTEDLSEDPAAVMKQVFDFIDVPDYQKIQFPRKNKGTYSSKIDQGLLSRLYDFYRPHNQRLEEVLGRKLNWDLK